MHNSDAKTHLKSMFDTALAAVQPSTCVSAALPQRPDRLGPDGRILVLGTGKASAAMAEAVEQAWPGESIQGLVTVPYGTQSRTASIEIVEAAHPVPDQSGVDAATASLRLAKGLGYGDLLLALISGGGSALWSCPAPGLTLADKQSVTKQMLACGADIHQINAVRRHLSGIKGGRLAEAAAPAQIFTLAISDVVGDNLSDIASGPTIGDPTTVDEVWSIVRDHKLELPANVERHLNSPQAETPKPSAAIFQKAAHRIIARGQDALEAAADYARSVGIEPIIFGDGIVGDAVATGQELAEHAVTFSKQGRTVVVLSGGEVTVNLDGAVDAAHGGPNRECALSFAVALNGKSNVWALMADTDGQDGRSGSNGPVAGAIVTPESISRARHLGIDLQAALRTHISGDVFAALGDQVVTGFTRTNVNDFRAILILPESA